MSGLHPVRRRRRGVFVCRRGLRLVGPDPLVFVIDVTSRTGIVYWPAVDRRRNYSSPRVLSSSAWKRALRFSWCSSRRLESSSFRWSSAWARRASRALRFSAGVIFLRASRQARCSSLWRCFSESDMSLNWRVLVFVFGLSSLSLPWFLWRARSCLRSSSASLRASSVL